MQRYLLTTFFKSCSARILFCQMASLILVVSETTANQGFADWQKDLSPLTLTIEIKSLPEEADEDLHLTLTAGEVDLEVRPPSQTLIYVVRLTQEGFVFHAKLPAGHQIIGQMTHLTIKPVPESVAVLGENAPLSFQSASIVITRYFDGTFEITEVENARLMSKGPTSFELVIGDEPEHALTARGSQSTLSPAKLHWLSRLQALTRRSPPDPGSLKIQVIWKFEVPPNFSACKPVFINKPASPRSPSKAKRNVSKPEVL